MGRRRSSNRSNFPLYSQREVCGLEHTCSQLGAAAPEKLVVLNYIRIKTSSAFSHEEKPLGRRGRWMMVHPEVTSVLMTRACNINVLDKHKAA